MPGPALAEQRRPAEIVADARHAGMAASRTGRPSGPGTHLAASPGNTHGRLSKMPELSTTERNKLKDDQFAYIDKSGERHLPIHDEEHVRNAIQRFGRTHFESGAAKERAAKAIVRAAKKHDIEIEDDDDVMKAAH
jgi:hypothetical protein